MNRALAMLVTLAAVAVPAASAQEWTFPAKPGETLEIDLETGGSIDIRGSGGGTVTVAVTVRGRDAAQVVVDAARTARGVRVSSEYKTRMRESSASADITVTVPDRFDVSFDTMGGDVRIEEVEGGFRGKSMGGSLTLLRLEGSAELTTMGGEIEVTDSVLEGSVTTMGGDVTFHRVGGGLRGKTMGGQLRIEDAEGAADGGEVVKIETMGGNIEVPSAPRGAEVKTMGGDIRIDSAKGFVKATTMGGRIRIGEMDGKVEAVTMGGDVEVHVVGEGGDVDISSMSGDLEIWLPADFSADFDLEIAYTRNSHGDYKMRSDFPVQETRTTEWEYHRGSPRKYIRAAGQAGAGKYQVRLGTVNGDIVIHRGN